MSTLFNKATSVPALSITNDYEVNTSKLQVKAYTNN